MNSSTTCVLKPTPGDPGGCDFKTKAPGPVKLKVTGTVGTILFTFAEYDGSPIAGVPSDTITFDIKPGNKRLTVVYGFGDPANGKGTLNEVCDANTFLANVDATIPPDAFDICCP